MNHLELLEVYRFDNKKRLGFMEDGGYVIGVLDGVYDCYISAGVAGEESFSMDFINRHRMDETNSFAFDGTISDYPYHYTDKITFFRKNIGCVSNERHSNLKDLVSRYDNIFLKMDIEGGEYPWLMSMEEMELKKFKQIVIEFHGITNNSYECDYMDKVRCLQKLCKTHYIIHAHGNNYSEVLNGIPDVIELTYVRKEYFMGVVPEKNVSELPDSRLDYPNYNARGDYDLNFYPFVSK